MPPLNELEELEMLRLQKAKAESMQDILHRAETDPTIGMSGAERFAAGYGKAGSDLALGAGGLARDVMEAAPGGEFLANKLHLPTPGDVSEMRGRDAPLMSTPSGMAGNVVGNIAAAVPTAFLPGASTIPGAAAYGAMYGAAQPAASGGERSANALMAGGVSGGITTAVRGAAAAGPALVAPFTKGGQERAALGTIERFAKDKGAIRTAKTDELIPGSKPSLAEVTGDPGIAQLQRAAQAKSPEVANLFAEAKTARLKARMDALRKISGDDYDRAYFEAARDATAKRLYGEAFKVPIDPKTAKAVAPDVRELLLRPSIRSAQKQAMQLAKEEGETLSRQDMGSIKGLHYVKTALDDQIGAAKRAGDDNLARLLMGTKDKLVGVMQKISPKYAEAMAEYQAASKPISRMDIGRYLYQKLVPAATEVGAERLTPAPFISALREGDKMAQQATGFKGAKLADILSTDDMNTVVNLAKDLGREIGATEMAKVAGSPTAQYLAASNAIRQVLGPLGLPESWVEKTIGQTLANWGSKFPFNVAEERIQTKLGELLVNPEMAQRLAVQRALSGGGASGRIAEVLGKRALPPVSIGIGSEAGSRK